MVTPSSRPTLHTAPLALSLFAPYRRCTITTPVDTASVRAQIGAQLDRLGTYRPPSWFTNEVRYDSRVSGDEFTISGPFNQGGVQFGRRGSIRVQLGTRGVIHAAPGGTAIDLTLSLSDRTLMTIGAQALFLAIGMLALRFPLAIVLFMLGFMYIAILMLFRHEASAITGHLLQAASPQRPFQTIAQSPPGSIVADGLGWRCAACGGYVRPGAPACIHCKHPFIQ